MIPSRSFSTTRISSQNGERPLILGGGLSDTGNVKFQPDDRFSTTGAFFVKGAMAFLGVLATLMRL
jgi:hypothetical protein